MWNRPDLTSIPQHWIKSERQSFGWSRKKEIYFFAKQRRLQRANALKSVCSNAAWGGAWGTLRSLIAQGWMSIRISVPRACISSIQSSSGIRSWWPNCDHLWNEECFRKQLTSSIWGGGRSVEEKAMAPHSSTLAWKIPWTEEPGGLQSMGSLGVGHDWATSLSLFTFMHWRRKWQPTPVFLPGESQGRRSLGGCRLWGRTELDTTEAT